MERAQKTSVGRRPLLWYPWLWVGGNSSAQNIIGWLVFVLPFVGLLAWFRVADVYHQHFFESNSNWTYLIYNFSRVLYSLYLIWLLYYVGNILLRSMEKKGVHLELGLLGEVVLCFFGGAAITSAVGFLLGYLQLYYYWILAPITLFFLCISYRSFVAFVVRLKLSRLDHRSHEESALIRGLRFLTLGALIFTALLLLMIKALPPGGGHDYYTHYFPYFKHVVKSHGLWPNDVWYHYYISKGATLVFWSIVLTDLQAPEIVTYSFVLVSGLAVCSIVLRWCGNRIFAMAAMAIFLAAFAFTPPFEFPSSDQYPIDWGEFQKHHEQTASLIASIAWLTLLMPKCAGLTLRAWALFACLFAGNTILFAPTSYPLVMMLLGLGMLGWALRKKWRMLKCFGAGIAAATFVLAIILLLNYWTTGLAEITPMRFFWKHADQERFSRIWSPFLMVLLQEGSSQEMGNVQVTLPTNIPFWEFTRALLRYRHLSNFFPWEILIPSLWLMIGLLLFRGVRLRFDLGRATLLIVGFLAASVLFAGASGQHVSSIRYFSFTIFFVNLFGVLTWMVFFELFPPRTFFNKLAHIAPAIFACWTALATLVNIPTDELTHCFRFALGRESLARGYEFRNALFPPAISATSNLPAGSRVYSFNQYEWCMAPNFELESFISYAFGKHWHEIMFESPERSRRFLQEERIDYFLIDLAGQVVDIIQYSPLFSVEKIATYLQVAWNEGDVYLLTWPGPGTHPLSESFLGRYRDNLPQLELAERTREVLLQQNMNYFLIDLKSAVPEFMQRSLLFSADNIANYLQVAWNEGDVYLLTWGGAGTYPLPEAFLTRYREIHPPDSFLQKNSTHMDNLRPLYERMRMIYETNKGKPYPIYRDPNLPPVTGWQ